MQTLPQPLTRNIQVAITEDAYARLKRNAAVKESSMGRLISDLALENLPAVEAVDAA